MGAFRRAIPMPRVGTKRSTIPSFPQRKRGNRHGYPGPLWASQHNDSEFVACSKVHDKLPQSQPISQRPPQTADPLSFPGLPRPAQGSWFRGSLTYTLVRLHQGCPIQRVCRELAKSMAKLISLSTFSSLISQDAFIEHPFFKGHRYGVNK